jgi:predicted TIM-barrel fold metal-dependent hydrolase
MLMFTPACNAFDQDIWAKELESFVPERVFDAHCHLWQEANAGNNREYQSTLRLEVDGQRLDEWSRIIFPGRELGFYYLGTPLRDSDIQGHNAFLLQESQRHHWPAAAIVTPQTTADQTAELLTQGFVGLKPYRSFAADPVECSIADYLPEDQMAVADHYGKIITLHLSKRNGLADPANQADLARYTKKYPRVTWILAHCARAFNSFMLEDNIWKLAEMGDNVWCDLSAVCDTYSHYLLLKHFNPRRLLFGSDNIAAGSDRGNYITWGRAWSFQPGQACSHCDGQATLVVYEQLRAMKRAADMAGSSQEQIRNLFSDNAATLFH